MAVPAAKLHVVMKRQGCEFRLMLARAVTALAVLISRAITVGALSLAVTMAIAAILFSSTLSVILIFFMLARFVFRHGLSIGSGHIGSPRRRAPRPKAWCY